MATKAVPTKDEVMAALAAVKDPELNVSIVELGLVYGVDVTDEELRVTMTLTTAACPMGEYLAGTVYETLRDRFPEGGKIYVDVVWDPPWSPEKISKKGKNALGIF